MNVLRREDRGYEAVRRECVWNARIADRFPDVIVQAEHEDDVAAAIALARDGDMKIGGPEYFAAAGPPRALWKTDSGHTGGIEAEPRQYERRVVGFFERYLLDR